jgi:hypothetical protein
MRSEIKACSMTNKHFLNTQMETEKQEASPNHLVLAMPILRKKKQAARPCAATFVCHQIIPFLAPPGEPATLNITFPFIGVPLKAVDERRVCRDCD